MTEEVDRTLKVRRRRRRRHHKSKNKLPVKSTEEFPETNVSNTEQVHKTSKKLKSHEEKILTYYKTLENCNKVAISVPSIDAIGIGDIIYFRKAVLKRHRPKLSALKKAKVFFKMRKEQTTASTGPNAILFRTFDKFNVGWPADWRLNTEENLSSEPLIMNFTDMVEVFKEAAL